MSENWKDLMAGLTLERQAKIKVGTEKLLGEMRPAPDPTLDAIRLLGAESEAMGYTVLANQLGRIQVEVESLLTRLNRAEAANTRLREVLVKAATPLEVLCADEDTNGAIREISPALRASIYRGRDAVRAVLASGHPTEEKP